MDTLDRPATDDCRSTAGSRWRRAPLRPGTDVARPGEHYQEPMITLGIAHSSDVPEILSAGHCGNLTAMVTMPDG